MSINADLVDKPRDQESKPKFWMYMVPASLDVFENTLKQISLTMLS